MLQTIEIGRSSGGLAALTDQDLFRVHFENLPRPAYIWRREGEDFALVAYNRAASEVPYSNVASLLNMTAKDLRAASTQNLFGDLEHCARERVILKREADFRYTTGMRRNLEITMVPLSDDIVVLHTEDVTERRQAEQRLRESEKKYRTIVDTAHEGIIAANLDSIITYANRRSAEILGYSADEMVGQSSLKFCDPDRLGDAIGMRDAFRRGERSRGDFCLRHRSGAEVWVSAAVSQLRDPSGKLTGLIYMIVDITERRRAEQALRDSETRMRALLDANPDLIVRLTRDGTYLDVHSTDPRVSYHLPLTMDDFIGRKVSEMFEPEFAREHERYRYAALATGQVQIWEYVRKDPWGSNRHIEARFVKSGERERTRIGQDLHDGLAQLLIGVRLLLSALRDKLSLSGSPHSDDADSAVELVSRAITQTSELAHGLSPIPKRGRLSDALLQLGQQSEKLLGVRCDVACLCTGLPQTLSPTTATHLYRITQEAITNAVKHGKATRIEINCSTNQGRIELTVADNGIGISADANERGGLGMHIMNYRARAVGGDISIAPRAGGGTIVRCNASARSPGSPQVEN